MTSASRVLGCLKGIAVGDAIGKQTETLSRARVIHWYPDGIRGFEGVPGAIIPRYAGNSKREWRIGETTDDTERTLAVARAIVAERSVSHVSIGREMLTCIKCVHPGIRSLWEFHQAADPARVATEHDGCGAAVRVAPVGVFYPSDSLEDLVSGAREASISTHGGRLAIAAAAATAAAVSAAIDGAPQTHVLERALRAATLAERRWFGRSESEMAAAIRAAYEMVGAPDTPSAAQIAACCFPDRPLTIVPLGIALATAVHSARDAILLAANVGGDSDSVASIAGGILGAVFPASVSEEWCATVETLNHHALPAMAEQLAGLRGCRR